MYWHKDCFLLQGFYKRLDIRAYERVSANVEAKFFYGNEICTGEIANLSENGIFISTKLCFPFETRFEIFIPIDGEVLKVPVRVGRIVKTGEFYDGMGVELLEQPRNYLEFVISLKSAVNKS